MNLAGAQLIVISFQARNQNVSEAVLALESANLLNAFHTTIAFAKNNALLRFLPQKIREELRRREFECSPGKIHVHPFPEILRLVANRMQLYRLTKPEGVLGTNTVGALLDKSVAQYMYQHADELEGVFGYEDASLHAFRAAGELGKFKIYELTTPYWEKVLETVSGEVERYPMWKDTLGSIDSSEAIRERKTQEAQLADSILCISTFVRNSLPESLRKKTRIVQYGFPAHSIDPARAPVRRADRCLRVLFVGFLSQRKGLADVFEAFKILKRSDIKLVVLGSLLAPIDFYRAQYADFEYHEPIAHCRVLDFMKTCDILVFPALCEGRGLVQLEAMSCGLPVIGTINATTDDLVDDGVDGFIVPVKSPAALAEKISWFADHPDEREEMSRRALEKSATLTWQGYRRQIIEAVTDLQQR